MKAPMNGRPTRNTCRSDWTNGMMRASRSPTKISTNSKTTVWLPRLAERPRDSRRASRRLRRDQVSALSAAARDRYADLLDRLGQ